MTDYAQVLASDGSTHFFPVTEGIDCAGAQLQLKNDPSPGSKVRTDLPDPGSNQEWYVKDCSGGSTSDVITDWQNVNP